MKKSGAQIFWETLEHEGVDVIFGYPGGSTLPIYDALINSKIHHVLVRHEQGAGHMADGYARASGKVGVAMATSGPGATNLVTAIATAYMDSVPVVFFTGQVVSPLIGYDAFQETDFTGISLPITKHNFLVTDAHDLAQVIREAFYIAKSGRPGPVVVDITKDAQMVEIEWPCVKPSPNHYPGYRPDLRPLASDLHEAAKMINQARNPVILAGNGILISGAMEQLTEFARHTQTPVATTLLGLGCFPSEDVLSLGMLGMHGEAWVNRTVQSADLVIALGMRFSDRVTGKPSAFATHAKKIHIDIDASEMNKNIHVDLALVGDVKETLLKLMPLIQQTKKCDWLEQIAEWKGESAVRNVMNLPDIGHLYPAHVIHDLWKLTKGNAIIASDVGQNQMWAAQYYRHQRPYTSITSGGLGTMGFGLPAGIGAKFGCPTEEVWVIAGDGGIQMTQAELAVLTQENVKVNIAIINNGFLGMVRQWQQFFYDKRYSSTPIASPDFVKLADAHGLVGIRVTCREEVEPAIRRAQRESGSVVIDFQVEKEDCVYPMVPTGSPIDQMILRSSK